MARKPLSERTRSIKRIGNLAMAMAASAIASESFDPVQLKERAITTKGRRAAAFDVQAERDKLAFLKAYGDHIAHFGEPCLNTAIDQAIRQNPLIGKPRASLLQLLEDQCRTLQYSQGYADSEYKQTLHSRLVQLLEGIESHSLSEQGRARRSIEKLHLSLKQARSNGVDVKGILTDIEKIEASWTGEIPLNDPYTGYFNDLDAVIELLATSKIRQGIVALNKYLFSRKRHEVMSYDIDRKRQILEVMVTDTLAKAGFDKPTITDIAA